VRSEYRGGQPWVRGIVRVRTLRVESTDAERALWRRLRAGQLGGYKFRRQHEFGGFVLDFFCRSAELAIEVDGGQHFSEEGAVQDAERTRYLEANGIRVLRFTNSEVLSQIDSVSEAILLALHGR
jgi:very-short-patch-repair endonuclease